MNYKIAIPSYKRADRIITLKYFNDSLKAKTTLYVNHDEVEIYKKHNPEINVVALSSQSTGNIAKIRNEIQELHGETPYICCDDDLELLFEKSFNEKGKAIWTKLTPETTEKMFEKMIVQAMKPEVGIVGISPRVRAWLYPVKLPYIDAGNPAVCVTAHHGKYAEYDEDLKLMEDLEYSMALVSKNKRVRILLNYGQDFNETGNSEGGLEEVYKDVNAHYLKGVKKLIKKYPGIVKPYVTARFNNSVKPRVAWSKLSPEIHLANKRLMESYK